MKRIQSLLVFKTTILILLISSCNKDTITAPPSQTNSLMAVPTARFTTTLLANHWEKKSAGVFSSTMPVPLGNIIDRSDSTAQVKVYLLDNGKKVLINTRTSFMNGMVWSSYTSTEVTIIYLNNRCNDVQDLPFSSLEIKVEVSN